MKTFKLNQKKEHLFTKGENFFYQTDLDSSIKSCTPGEWVEVQVGQQRVLGFVNPFVTKGSDVILVGATPLSPDEYVISKVQLAIKNRERYDYEKCCRLIYGQADSLPGLVVDCYSNAVIVQISSAGMDKYREKIKEILESSFGDIIYFLDNEKYRLKEGLPIYEKDNLPEVIKIKENKFDYEITREQLQKIGYYYDHRENRSKLENVLERLNRNFTNGLDLFCYIGSWGMHLLRAGAENVTFVDQANMENVVTRNCEINDYSKSQIDFERSDVFKYLDKKVSDGSKFDVIVCDPPAFNKSSKTKGSSLIGYEKLYQRIFKILESDSVLAAASCTQNVTLEDLDACVQKMAKKVGRRVQLVDLGLQGFDHPIESLKSRSNYIKYLCYIVE